MTGIEKVTQFLKEAETYYLATVEGDQPRVRPFGTAHLYEGKLYIQTGKVKDVSKQLLANPKAEICAFKDGEWIRVAGELVEDDRVEARQSMLDAYPSLQQMYSADDGNTQVFISRMQLLRSVHSPMNRKLSNSENKITVHAICPVNLLCVGLQGIYFQLFKVTGIRVIKFSCCKWG